MRAQHYLLSIFALILIDSTNASSLWRKEECLSSRGQNHGRAATPAPIVVPPSQNYDGDDGQWSSLGLRVGSPPQNVRVLVSTNSPSTLVVLPLGCSKEAINPVPPNCASDRGLSFNSNASTTWKYMGRYGINDGEVGFEANLEYSVNADYGLETLGLGHIAGDINGPTLENQTVASIAAASPFYTGIFGLGTQPVNFSILGNDTAPSFFTSLKDKNLIPSLSWSYTAGARYQLKSGGPLQLIFGGYDASRFVENAVNFTLNNDVTRDVLVAVQSISFAGTTQQVLLAKPIYAFIESTDPNFWLPAVVCRAFENAFGISADNQTGLYLINAAQYANLSAINPSVTFTLANSLSGGRTVDIVLPFNAFILQASFPFAPNTTSYFPLRQAANDTQYTLGRTFLQEAYLTVNYDTGSFSVSQCTWKDGEAPQIIPISSKSSSGSNSGSSGNGTDVLAPVSGAKSTGLATGAKVGIAIGVVGFVGIAGILSFLLFRPKKRHFSVTPTHTTLGAESVIAADAPKSPSNSFKPDNDVNIWPLSTSQGQDPIALLKLHHQRSELSGASDVRELPAEDNREGDYSTEDQRTQSRRNSHSTPELAGSEWLHELDGGPVPEHLPQISESQSPGPSPSSTFQRPGSSELQLENGVSPIHSIRSNVAQMSIPSPQESWLDTSNTSNTGMSPINETGITPENIVSPISPPYRTSGPGVSPLRFNRRGSRVGGPLSPNRSDRLERSNRSLRSENLENEP